jgi:beta-phosphoglucomutase
MTGAALWDLDGTVVDSEEYHWLAWRETMGAEGLPITREQFLATFGYRNDEILPKWLGSDATPERMQRIAGTKERLYRDFIRQRGLEPLPGAREWIDRLAESGWKQAIASSAPRENIETVLEVTRLASDFQAVVAGEDVTAGKPDPQVFLIAASRLGAIAERCVVVEDAAAGIEAARRAGMRSIGVRSRLAADLAVSSLTELPPDAFSRLLGDRKVGGA